MAADKKADVDLNDTSVRPLKEWVAEGREKIVPALERNTEERKRLQRALKIVDELEGVAAE